MKKSRIVMSIVAVVAAAGLGTGNAMAADAGPDTAGASPARAMATSSSSLVPAGSIHYSEEYQHDGLRNHLGNFTGGTPCNSGYVITGNVLYSWIGQISSFRTWSWCQANHRSGWDGTGDASGWWGGVNNYIGGWMNDRTLSVQFR
ncbi:hypothetical protein [Streptomyces sp. NPDC002054]|uniref:hypothetical protein n=1 Tax=Streptomyces sp. NPDC002054 TaxID=3154663 RepID=UPI0033257FB6